MIARRELHRPEERSLANAQKDRALAVMAGEVARYRDDLPDTYPATVPLGWLRLCRAALRTPDGE